MKIFKKTLKKEEAKPVDLIIETDDKQLVKQKVQEGYMVTEKRTCGNKFVYILKRR